MMTTYFLRTFLILSLIAPAISHAQFRETNRFERLAAHTLDAAADVFSWYDAPVYILFLVNKYELVNPSTKPVVIVASQWERSVARDLGVGGSESIGSLDPFSLPHAVLGARALQIAAIELLQEDGDAGEELRHAMGMYRSVVYTQVATQAVKNLVERKRPDGSDDKSFFSGHTSVTFATCSWLQKEIDDAITHSEALDTTPLLRDVLRGVAFTATYGWAGYVGYSRIRDNKHYLGDVLVGAAVGTLTSHLIYQSLHETSPSLVNSIGFGVANGTPTVNFVYCF